MSKKDMRLTSQILMAASGLSVLLATLGCLGTDIWLASTQWLLVAAILALFGVYFKQ